MDGRRSVPHSNHRGLNGDIPYIDANPLGNGYYTYKQRKFAIWTFSAGFIGLWVAMIFIGTFIRGPGWMWFWPTEVWDAERVEFTVNRNLDQIFGINGSWLAHLIPAANQDYAPILARMIFGIFPIVLYFVGAAYIGYRMMNSTSFARKIFQRMTLLQIVTTDILLILMLSLPVKMVARLIFRVKYVWGDTLVQHMTSDRQKYRQKSCSDSFVSMPCMLQQIALKEERDA